MMIPDEEPRQHEGRSVSCLADELVRVKRERDTARMRLAQLERLASSLAGLRGEIHDAGEVDAEWAEVDAALDLAFGPTPKPEAGAA